MFGPRSSFCAVLLVGCGSTGEPLERLTRAWAAETIERASDSLTGSLLLAAIAMETCVQSADGGLDWNPSVTLSAALGEPERLSSEAIADDSQQFVWAGVTLAGQADQVLRFTTLRSQDGLSFDFEPLLNDDDDIERLDGFGHTSLAIESDCSLDGTFVSGQALWVDAAGRRHEVRLPADSELGSSMLFSGTLPWVPLSGSTSWSAKFDGQERTIATEDASEIRVNESGDVLWPVTVHGPNWSGEGLTEIAP